jgi:hypothetical protein
MKQMVTICNLQCFVGDLVGVLPEPNAVGLAQHRQLGLHQGLAHLQLEKERLQYIQYNLFFSIQG